jgi:predicted dehydrogenase
MVEAALVGLGRWGRSLLASAQGKSDRIRFSLGVDPSPSDAAKALEGPQFKRAADLDEALSSPAIKAVVLATPHSLHRSQVLRCAEAGKHVFCEKPLALTADDARVMVDACRRRGVVLAVGHNRRFWPSVRELKRLADAGELGRLLHIEGHNSNENSNSVTSGWRTSPEESPGGGMTGAGLHVLDAFIGLLGPVLRVQAQLLEHKPGPAPLDSVCASYAFASGASGILASVRATPFYWRLHLFGSAGSAEAVGESEVHIRKSGAPLCRSCLPPVDSLRAELDAFADAVEGGQPFPIPPEQALATVEAFEGTIRSLQSGTLVRIDARAGAPSPGVDPR